MITKLAYAVMNDVVAGLVGITSTPTISIEQLEDDVVDERLQIIKEYSLKNLIPKKDLFMAINCVEVDCQSLDKCLCTTDNCGNSVGTLTTPQLHFEIPQVINDFAESAIEYIGAIDRSVQYWIYTDVSGLKSHQYRRRGASDPYVYIETTPNENNLYDGWIFNAPFTKKISIIAIFKDPRQVYAYGCCPEEETENFSFLSNEIKKRLTQKKLLYYKQLYQGSTPNTQTPK